MFVCPDCFDKDGLKRRIVDIGPYFDDELCDHHETKKGIPVSDVAEIIREVNANNYHHSGVDHNGEPTGKSFIDILYDLIQSDHHDVIEVLEISLIENDSWWPPDGGEQFFQVKQATVETSRILMISVR